MLKGEYERQAGLEESVLVLAKSYFEYVIAVHSSSEIKDGFESALGIETENKLEELDVFTDNGENIELRHEWANLNQSEANLIVTVLNRAFNDLLGHFNNVRSAPSPLKLSGEGELPDPNKPLEPNPNLTLRR